MMAFFLFITSLENLEPTWTVYEQKQTLQYGFSPGWIISSWTIVMCFLNSYFFQIFYHKSHIWKVLIMNNCNMLSQFVYSFNNFITNLTFEKFQICYHKSHIYEVFIMNNCNVLSKFAFFFKYFITNLTFERFPSWTIVISFLWYITIWFFFEMNNVMSKVF